MATKKPAKKVPAKKTARRSTPAKRAVPKGSPKKALRAVPKPDPTDTAEEVLEGKEDTKEAAGEAPKDRPPKRKTPKAPPKRPAIPQLKSPAFEPKPDLLQPIAQDGDWLRAVLYGDQGVGKTTSLASLAARGVVAIVDPENSVRRKALIRRGINVDNIRLWPAWSYDDLLQFYVTIKAMLEDDPGSIFAVGVDTVSSILAKWLEDAVAESLARPSMQKKHPERTQFDIFQEDYGTVTEQIRSVFVHRLFTLPCHVIVTAHSRRAENETGLVQVGPQLNPASQSILMTHADWVLQLTQDRQGNRRVMSAPKGMVMAKDRFGVLDSESEDMDMLDLLTVWESDE